MIKCNCGGELKKAFSEIEFYGISFGIREVEVCKECGTEYLSNEIMAEIEKEVKKRNLFGLQKDGNITKSGNSLVVRIPPEIAKFARIRYKEQIRIYPASKDRIEIELRG